MAQAGFTPIQLYFSTTAAATPSAGNLANGELAVNITDGKLFYKDNGGVVRVLAGTGGSGVVAGSNTQVQFNNNGVFGASANMTFNGTRLTVADLADSGLTSGRVVYASTGGALVDSANLTFDGTTLVANSFTDSSLTSGRVTYATTGGNLTDSANLLYSGTDLTVYGITVGRGAGAVATNTAVGASALAANTSGDLSTGIGYLALQKHTTGRYNTAIGGQALRETTTGQSNVAVGLNAVLSNTTGGNNVGVGESALISNTTASNNTAVGYWAGYSNTTGTNVTALGQAALVFNTTGSQNVAVGNEALRSNTTASGNTAVGYQAGYSNTTGYALVAIGESALYANTIGYENTAVGDFALAANTTGVYNTAVGTSALQGNTTASGNTAMGLLAMRFNTTGGANTAIGQQALYSNTTASNNTAVGYLAGFSNTTGERNTFFGRGTGYSVTTGTDNTFLGRASGEDITTGSKNTIIGRYTGNQGGIDIRTSSNNIVLSDGDGNPRQVYNNTGGTGLGAVPLNAASIRGYELGTGGAAYHGNGSRSYLTANAFWNDSQWTRVVATPACQLVMDHNSGAFVVNSAATGSAGSLVAFTNIIEVNRGTTLALQGANTTSGTGITFPATQSASSNANTLDDYEEGTFTTSIAAETNVSAVSLAVGNYIKIGKQVTLFVKFGFTVTSSNSYTFWNFTLPFTSDSINDNAGACVENNAARIGGVSTYGASAAVAYVLFPAAAQVPSGTNSCYISFTYRATA